MAAEHGLIEPFESNQIKQNGSKRLISYGTSSYGYDVRCASEFRVFTNINSVIVDPKNFDSNSFVDVDADVCIIPPNSFVLARTVEYFRIPRNILTLCLGKSTYARCATIIAVDTAATETNCDSIGRVAINGAVCDCQCDATGAGMGRPCDTGIFQYNAVTCQDLRE